MQNWESKNENLINQSFRITTLVANVKLFKDETFYSDIIPSPEKQIHNLCHFPCPILKTCLDFDFNRHNKECDSISDNIGSLDLQEHNMQITGYSTSLKHRYHNMSMYDSSL